MAIWFGHFTLEEINGRAQDSLSDYLGMAFTEKGDHFLTATMPVDRRTKQPMGLMHGGASAALAETVGSAAANYCVDQNRFVCVGLELNINHIRSVQSGTVKAIATPFHVGKTTQVWEIKIWNEEGKLTSVSRLTMAVIEKKTLSEERGSSRSD